MCSVIIYDIGLCAVGIVGLSLLILKGMYVMKKFAAGLIAAAMSVTMLAGCGVPANTVHSVDDLEGKTIGVQLGTTGDIYAEDVKDAKVEKYNKGADAVQALKQGKIDAVIIDAEPAKVFVEKNDDLEILEEPFAEEEYAIAMKLDNTELQTAVNGALKELKADGTLDAIKANYVGENAGKNPYKSPDNVSRDKGTLVMATNAEFPPYESKENDKVVGIDADMMQAVCDKLGYELKIDDMAFDSIISAVQSGKADVGVAGMTVTPDREKNVLFSDTYTSSSQVIIVRKK